MGRRFPLSISVDLTYNYKLFVLDYGVCIATFPQLLHPSRKAGDWWPSNIAWWLAWRLRQFLYASQFNHIWRLWTEITWEVGLRLLLTNSLTGGTVKTRVQRPSSVRGVRCIWVPLIMIKGATTNLAFLTDILGCRDDEYRDSTQERRRRAIENSLRKYKGDN